MTWTSSNPVIRLTNKRRIDAIGKLLSLVAFEAGLWLEILPYAAEDQEDGGGEWHSDRLGILHTRWFRQPKMERLTVCAILSPPTLELPLLLPCLKALWTMLYVFVNVHDHWLVTDYQERSIEADHLNRSSH